jgi:hypothetical protein
MSWVAVAVGVGGSLLSGYMASQGGKKQQEASQQNDAANRAWQEHMYDRQLGDSRANQVSDYGSLTWEQDPKTGKWTQTNKMDDAEKGRLEDYRQIAADRMATAKGLSANLPQGAINYDALGLGKIASAAGVQGGGNSDAQADARAGKGIVGMPGFSNQQLRGMQPSPRPMGGGSMMGPPPGQGGPGGPGPAGVPGGQRQPYTPAQVRPTPPPQPTAPPPAAAAPPPAQGPTPGMSLDNYMNSGMQGVDNNMYDHLGGDAMLAEAKKFDPNARWNYQDIGSGGDDPHPQQGRALQFDPALYAAALRKQQGGQ